MQPKSYLNFLSKNWALITELFEISRGIPIDYVGLTQTIRAFYPYIELHSFIKKLEEYEIIEKDLSYESVYSLSDKTDQIVELILNEQQLGLSDSIRVYIEQFDKLSLGLLKAVQNKNLDEIVRFFKKINRQIQSVIRQSSHNYKGIENLVAQSKKQDSIVPLKQRYADVINAWEDYIIPMGEFIKSNDSFDTTVDKAITRLNAAITFLENSSSMSSERQNIHTSKRKFEDMRGHLINTFGFSKALLEPLYKTARLNSKVTKGVSTILDHVRKERFDYIDNGAALKIYKKENVALLSSDLGVIRYYIGIKNIKENPTPPILLLNDEEKAKIRSNFIPPLNKQSVLKKFQSSLPVDDVAQWVIDRYPDLTTGRTLEAIWLIMTHKNWQVQKLGKHKYRTTDHLLTGQLLKVEKNGWF